MIALYNVLIVPYVRSFREDFSPGSDPVYDKHDEFAETHRHSKPTVVVPKRTIQRRASKGSHLLNFKVSC